MTMWPQSSSHWKRPSSKDTPGLEMNFALTTARTGSPVGG